MPVRLTPRPAPLEMLTMRPEPRRLHGRHDGLRHDEGAGDVDVEDDLPLLRRHVFHRPADLAADAAGIVDQDVDAAARGEHLFDEGRDRVDLGDVDGAYLEAAACRRLRFGLGDLQRLCVDVAGPGRRRRAPRRHGRWRGRSRARRRSRSPSCRETRYAWGFLRYSIRRCLIERAPIRRGAAWLRRGGRDWRGRAAVARPRSRG